jgi:hypothetical protein
MAIGVLSLWLWCLVSVRVRSMTAHKASTERVDSTGHECGECEQARPARPGEARAEKKK